MKAVRYHEFGGPEVLRYEEVPTPEAGAGEVLIKVAAIGINASEVSRRAGRSPMLPGTSLPMVPGYECSGTVEAVGSGVTEFKKGDRVLGRALLHTYLEYAAAPADQVYKLPDAMDMVDAGTFISGFTTAWQALVECAKVQPGEQVLVQAAASGVGVALVQLAKHLGATVIGTAGTDEKLEWAKQYGLDHGINYTEKDFVEEVKALTDGKGVPVVIDGLGGEILPRGLNCLQPGGRLAVYGRAAGGRTVEIVLPPLWGNSLSIIGVSSGAVSREDAYRLLELCAAGTLKATVDRTWPLQEAAEAHRYFEARKVRGRVALTVAA